MREHRIDTERSTDDITIAKQDNGVQNGTTRLVTDTSGGEVVYHEPPCPHVDELHWRVEDYRFRPCQTCVEDAPPTRNSEGDTGLSPEIHLTDSTNDT